MKKTFKNKKGITLVALVITIILLLILAGISIATLTGSGLFEKARLAKEQSEERQREEEQTLGDYANKINEYVDGTRNNNSVGIDYDYENPIVLFQKAGWEKYNEDTVIVDNYKVQQDGLFSVCMGLAANSAPSNVMVYINGKMIDWIQAYSITTSPIHLPVKKDDVIKVLVKSGSYVYAGAGEGCEGEGIVIYPLVK